MIFSRRSLDKNVLDGMVRRQFTDMPTQITVSFYSVQRKKMQKRNLQWQKFLFLSRVWRLFFNTFSLLLARRVSQKSRSWQGDERLQERLGMLRKIH